MVTLDSGGCQQRKEKRFVVYPSGTTIHPLPTLRVEEGEFSHSDVKIRSLRINQGKSCNIYS